MVLSISSILVILGHCRLFQLMKTSVHNQSSEELRWWLWISILLMMGDDHDDEMIMNLVDGGGDSNRVPIGRHLMACCYPHACPPQDCLHGGQSWGGQFGVHGSSRLPSTIVNYREAMAFKTQELSGTLVKLSNVSTTERWAVPCSSTVSNWPP